jgi:hypothetical protein
MRRTLPRERSIRKPRRSGVEFAYFEAASPERAATLNPAGARSVPPSERSLSKKSDVGALTSAALIIAPARLLPPPSPTVNLTAEGRPGHKSKGCRVQSWSKTVTVNCSLCGNGHEFVVRDVYTEGMLRDATDTFGRA